MNFRTFFFLLLLTACGVKGDPSTPKNTPSPSLMQNYPDIQLEKPLDEVKTKR